jgi:hypothetical protein
MIENIEWFSCKAHYFCPILIKPEQFQHIFKKYQISMKIHPVGAKWFHVVRRTGITKLIVSLSLCNFANMPKNEKFCNMFTHAQREGIF